MKKTLAIVLALVMVLGLAACGGSSASTAPAANTETKSNTETKTETAAAPADSGDKPLAGTYDITVWVADAIVDLTKEQIDTFNKTNEDGIVINATVEAVGEGEAATQMITDVEAGGDLFCFAQDQFARLVQAGALSKLGVQAGETVKTSNDEGAVLAATLDGELWAYPLTADNGYFMYYDKSVIPEEDLDSLEAIIADCEAAGKNFSMETETSAWYMASFFFGTGCVSEWDTDADGNWTLNDTFNSDAGLIACKGMQKLVTSPNYMSSSEASDFSKGSAVVVSGPWAFNTAKGILGDNLGATDLPSFEVDGTEYHMGSFRGFKLMGVKPQTDAVKSAVMHRLAQYLTGEECQLQRFDAAAWGPSNLAGQQDEAVLANEGLIALREQYPYSTLQGQIGGKWWDIAKVIATNVKEAADEADFQAALDQYDEALSEFINMDADAANAWGVIGTCNSEDGFFYTDYTDETRSNWSEDIPMEEQEDGTWKTVQAWDMEEGCEFKVRQGGSWDNAFPADNFKVETAGTYFVVLDPAEGTVSLLEG